VPRKRKLPKSVLAFLSEIGHKGGKAGRGERKAAGGKARARNLTAAERREASSHAASLRWQKTDKAARRRAARKAARARWAKKAGAL